MCFLCSKPFQLIFNIVLTDTQRHAQAVKMREDLTGYEARSIAMPCFPASALYHAPHYLLSGPTEDKLECFVPHAQHYRKPLLDSISHDTVSYSSHQIVERDSFGLEE